MIRLISPSLYQVLLSGNLKIKFVMKRFPKRRLFPWLCASYDLWYTIHQDSWYFPSSSRTPYVMTINDLNFLGEKQGINRKYRLKRLQVKVNHAKIVTAISSFTASEIRKYLNVEKKRDQGNLLRCRSN